MLQMVFAAEEEGSSLDQAGTDAHFKLGWTLDQYAACLRRLEDRGMLEVEVVHAGGGIGFARPLRVTDTGWLRVEIIRQQTS